VTDGKLLQVFARLLFKPITLLEIVLIVAERQKARRTNVGRHHHLDCDPSFLYIDGNRLDRFYSRCLCTVGPVQQLGGVDLFLQ